MENGLDKCSSLPSSDMKIGSHSGLLSRLINILSANAALGWERRRPAHTCWQEAHGLCWGQPGGQEGGWLLPRACQRCSSVRLTRTGASLTEAPECPWRWEGRRKSRLSTKTDPVASCARHWAWGKGTKANEQAHFIQRRSEAWLITWPLQSPLTFPFKL